MDRAGSKDIDIIGHQDAGTVPGLFTLRVERSPHAVAYSEFSNGKWRDVTWSDMARIVGRYRGALDRAGMEPGTRVAVMLPNCIDWIAFDIAAMANGLITVPLYNHDSAANIVFILSNTGARLCLMDSAKSCLSLLSALKTADSLSEVWLHQGGDAPASKDGLQIRSLSDALSEAGEEHGPLRCAAQDTAVIIHTSGTTGEPKGAMLSHDALLWNAEGVTEFIPPLTSDIFLSLLPLAHAFERSMTYHLAMMGGARVAFARGVSTLRQDLLEVRPTVLVAVPRLYERLYDTILRKTARSPIRKWLALRAASIGWRVFEARHHRGIAPGLITRAIWWPILEKLVARPVQSAFGGRLRVAVSGGAPLSKGASRFLIGLGLPLVEGYGLTEAAPVVTATSLEDNCPGSVGRPLRDIETRLGAEGELLIRSPGLMQGYWEDPARSVAAIDSEGWLHTGDIAELNEGRVYITGRLKDLIVLSTGKKVATAEVEAAIAADPLVEQCCAIGDSEPYVGALVVLNRELWAKLANYYELDAEAPNTPAAARVILAQIAKPMHGLPPFARARAVYALLEPWTVEDGSLTPTLKVKRRVIEDRYRSEVAALFEKRSG